jgi:signal transduction histidine kinase
MERLVPQVWDQIWERLAPHLCDRETLQRELVYSLGDAFDVSACVLYDLHAPGQVRLAVQWGEGAPDERLARRAVAVPERCLQERGEGCTWLALPLPLERNGGREVVGVLAVGRRSGYGFSGGEVNLWCALALRAAWAVHYARRAEHLDRAKRESERRIQEQTEQLSIERDQLELLYYVAREMTHSLDLDRMLNRSLVRVGNALGVRQGSILLLDPDSGSLIYRAALGRPLVLPKGGKRTRYRRGVGLAGWVLEYNQGVVIGDVDADPRWEPDPGKQGQPTSALAVPFSSEGEALGVMLLFVPQLHYFTEHHLWLATAAANQITAAIKNHELYRLIREQAARLGQMLRAQRSVTSQHLAILSSLTDGVAVSDDSDRLLTVNEAVTRILKPPEAGLVGAHVESLFAGFPEEARQGMREAIASVRERFARSCTESVQVTLSRQDQVVQVTLAPLSEQPHLFSGNVLVIRDITLEHEVIQAKNEFISTVAHELRTPMTSIRGYTDLLLHGATGKLNEGQERFLSIVKSNTERMAALVADLLDISRIEAGQVPLAMASLDLEKVMRELRDSVIETIHERGLELNITCEPGLPAVRADYNRLMQILHNLVSNAYRYTLPGGWIAVSARRAGDAVQVDVQDTGIGIAAEDRERIFERFFRADHPVVKKQSGTGLGLSIVRTLVQMHDGKLWVESEPGRGSTFSFTLPLGNLGET